MNPDTHVYCTHCKNFKVTYINDINGEPFCLNEKHCNFWNFEDSKPFSERPYYEDHTTCDYHQILEDDAKIFSDIAEISAEESTKILQEVMKTYKLTDEETNRIVDKLYSVNTGYPIPAEEIYKTVIHLERCKGCKWDYFEFSENEDDTCWYCSRSYDKDTEQAKILPDLYVTQ